MTHTPEMKILIAPSFGVQVVAAFQAAGHDVEVAAAGELSYLIGRAAKSSRVLVTDAGRLPELTSMNCLNLAVVLLEGQVAAPESLRQMVMPILANLKQGQLNNVFTLISENTRRRISYLCYEGERPVARVVVPADCSEHFLHAGADSSGELEALGIKLSGISSVTPSYEVCRTQCDFHLFALVESGALEVSSDKSESVVSAGEVLSIPVGTQCRYHAREKTTFLWFHLMPEVFNEAGAEARVHVSQAHNPETLLAYARQYREEAASLFFDSGEALLPLATLMGQQIRRHLRGLNLPREEYEGRRYMNKAMSALRDNGAQAWTVQELAQAAGCSVPHFHRLARRILAKTPYQMIQDARMHRACNCLIHTDFKMEQIATIVGYSDAFAFSRAFKKYFGKSPCVYRDSRRRTAGSM